jgi:hypothetical protein
MVLGRGSPGLGEDIAVVGRSYEIISIMHNVM